MRLTKTDAEGTNPQEMNSPGRWEEEANPQEDLKDTPQKTFSRTCQCWCPTEP